MDKKFTKKWLVGEIYKRYNAEKTGEDDFKLYLSEIKGIFNVFEDIICEIIENRDELKIYGLFTIGIKTLPEREIYDFPTKKMKRVAEKDIVIMKPSQKLNELLESQQKNVKHEDSLEEEGYV